MSGPFGSSQWMYNASSGLYGFEIDNSVRFETGSNGHLTHTLGTAANRQINTTSFWVKRNKIAVSTRLFATGASLNSSFSNSTNILFNPTEDLSIYQETGGSAVMNIKTAQLFRDTSAWYHIVFAIDTTQGTDTNRVKIYVNGVRVTSFTGDTAFPTQNLNTHIFTAEIRRWARGQTTAYADVQFAQIAQISGVQHEVGDFGELKNDIWIPKDITGLTYAAGSYLLEFKNSGVGTASSSTVGADTSGNDLHFTSSGLAVHDQVPDSPTNNFATLNPLDNNGSEQWSEGNLKWYSTTSDVGITRANFAVSSGKWYWEINLIGGSRLPSIGIADQAQAITADQYYVGQASGSYGYFFNGKKYNNASSSSYGSTYTTGDIISVAFNADNGQLTFYKNGTSQGVAYTVTSGKSYAPALGKDQTSKDTTSIVNFGQDSSFAGNETAQGNADENGIGDFYYAPPSGFLALCTANLPDPVAAVDPAKGGSPQDYFNTVLWTGNGGTQSITGVGFQPDWVWIKDRSEVDHHVLTDSIRGVTKSLFSNLTNAEVVSAQDLTSFGADGFTVGTNDRVNGSSDTHVAWNWKAGTSFSNDASSTGVGSIDSSGSVNTDVGFSIISYTGTGSAGTVAHGLGVAPEMYIVKRRDADGHSWPVYTSTLGATKQLRLSGTNAEITAAGITIWNNTEPTSSVFSVGTNTDSNASSGTYIAYCFASVDGYSKIGSYTANSNADGPFVYTGFRPAWLLIKKTDGSASWWLVDSTRNPFNVTNKYLLPDASTEESAGSDYTTADFVSNGFKIRNTSTAFNSGTHIYMAFAEQPFKYANAR